MEITSTYSVRLHNFIRVFDDTVEVYRNAVDFFIELVMTHWESHFAHPSQANDCIRAAESECSDDQASDDDLQLLSGF